MAALGLLGGSFNPPHLGHLALARAALTGLDLERVLLVPVGLPPHKDLVDDPGAETRFELCKAACEGEEMISPSRVEIDRDGPSFTIDTLEAILAAEPDTDITLILGADMALSLPSWRSPDRVVSIARIAWADRSGANADDVDAIVRGLGGKRPAQRIAMEPVEVSSTMVRRAAARSEPLDGLVSPAVARLIEAGALYGKDSCAK